MGSEHAASAPRDQALSAERVLIGVCHGSLLLARCVRAFHQLLSEISAQPDQPHPRCSHPEEFRAPSRVRSALSALYVPRQCGARRTALDSMSPHGVHNVLGPLKWCAVVVGITHHSNTCLRFP